MPDVMELRIGDVVRIRETILLMPLSEHVPSEIPAGIYGQVSDVIQDVEGELACYVEFYEPYEIFNELPLRARHLELMFRFSLN